MIGKKGDDCDERRGFPRRDVLLRFLTQHDEGRALGTGDPDEEFGHGEEETPDGGHDDRADEDEGDVLRPEDHVDL